MDTIKRSPRRKPSCGGVEVYGNEADMDSEGEEVTAPLDALDDAQALLDTWIGELDQLQMVSALASGLLGPIAADLCLSVCYFPPSPPLFPLILVVFFFLFCLFPRLRACRFQKIFPCYLADSFFCSSPFRIFLLFAEQVFGAGVFGAGV
ncbi:uncharacterized protein LOC134776456 [Penaeus indicus]|uniref:uncharacterized protein LOC134776456 n=1 Tax=Penaeus indicus TaxID=29960 RepID=UPI00300CD271